MAIGTSPAPQPTAKRSVPRYKLTVPADIVVLRSGIPQSIPGRTVEIGEGGMGVVLASRLLLGESVRIEFLLPHTTAPVRATAVVRYQRELCCGLQFVRLPDEQKSVIRYWTRCEAALALSEKVIPLAHSSSSFEGEHFGLNDVPVTKRRWVRSIGIAASAIVLAAVLQWWHWQQGWAELEAQSPESAASSSEPVLQVPAELMQRRIRHQVAPAYPADALRSGVQGTVLLDAIVNRDGTVKSVQYRGGPVALSNAAMEAVRWWRYEPYLVNGEAAPVETLIAVEFRSGK